MSFSNVLLLPCYYFVRACAFSFCLLGDAASEEETERLLNRRSLRPKPFLSGHEQCEYLMAPSSIIINPLPFLVVWNTEEIILIILSTLPSTVFSCVGIAPFICLQYYSGQSPARKRDVSYLQFQTSKTLPLQDNFLGTLFLKKTESEINGILM